MTTPTDLLRWSDAEKKIARRVFDQALHRELDEVIHQVKQMARDDLQRGLVSFDQ